jgi:nucleoside-diphosphate-sugar epimerase
MMPPRDVILITGASGRIGFMVAERFVEKYQIIGFDIFLTGHLPGVELIGVDMASEESLDDGLKEILDKFGNRISSVIHLAAYYSFSGGGWSQYQRITVDGTERLFKGLRKYNFHVEQFVFSSTMLVHAPSVPGQKIDENSAVIPKWNYPKSKVLTEDLIHRMQGDIPSVIMRIAGVYDDRCHSIPLSNQVQRIYENQLEGHLFAGDSSHGAAFVHMDDLIEAIWLAVEKRKELPHELVLLIGEEETYSYDAIQKEIAKCLYGKKWQTWSVPKMLAKIGAFCMQYLPFGKNKFIKPWMIDIADDHYELDISRAKKNLQWKPRYKLINCISVWIDQLKKEPLAWYDENRLKPSEKILKEKS